MTTSGRLMAHCKYEALRQLRNWRWMLLTLGWPLFYYFLFVHLNGAKMSIAGTLWDRYFLMSMAAFSIIGTALNGLASRVAVERAEGWSRLLQTTPMPPWTYVTSKIVVQLGLGAVIVVILFLAGDLGQGVHLSLGMWLGTWLWLTLAVAPFVALGVLLGLVAGKETAGMASSAVYFLLSMAGGLWWPIQIMPKFLQHLAQWLPTYRLADGAWRMLAGHAPAVKDLALLLGYLVVFTLAAMWVVRRRQAALT